MTALHLCGTADASRLSALTAQYDLEMGVSRNDEERRAAFAPLLDGSPHGAVWLWGPKVSPVGFAAFSFGWSPDVSGLIGRLETLWIRPGVRGRGMAGEVLVAMGKSLAEHGVCQLSAYIPVAAERLFIRSGFIAAEDGRLMQTRL
mgnify:FL=1